MRFRLLYRPLQEHRVAFSIIAGIARVSGGQTKLLDGFGNSCTSVLHTRQLQRSRYTTAGIVSPLSSVASPGKKALGMRMMPVGLAIGF